MARYRYARPEERDDYIDLANYVFGIDFEKLLPKVYHEQDQSYRITRVAETEAGRLVSQIAVLPQTVRSGGRTLCAGYLGTVSVHPRERGKGHMKALMDRWLDEMRKNCEISVLDGQRQRYEYFGYTSGGIQWIYTVNQSNIRHALRDADASGVAFEPFLNQQGMEELAARLNEARPVYVLRDAENMRRILTSYHQTPFAILDGGKPVGYLLKNPQATEISELALCDADSVERVVKAYFDRFSAESVTIRLPDYERELHTAISSFAESHRIEPSGMYNIFQFANVLEMFLSLKHSAQGLCPGVFSAVMDGQPITIKIDAGGVSVSRDAPSDAVVLNKMEAQRLILTPFGRNMGISVPSGWFPLPLFWYTVDCF